MGRASLASFPVAPWPSRLAAASLSSAGIGTQIHYPIPPHLSGAYSGSVGSPAIFPLPKKLPTRNSACPESAPRSQQQKLPFRRSSTLLTQDITMTQLPVLWSVRLFSPTITLDSCWKPSKASRLRHTNHAVDHRRRLLFRRS